jgi:hypothetical protein
MSNNKSHEYFGDGEFNFDFVSSHSQLYFKSAHKAITNCEMWNWLRNFQVDENRGFMFTQGVPELSRISEEMAKDPVNEGHSGASYGCTMRSMDYIAKNGYDAFIDKIRISHLQSNP